MLTPKSQVWGSTCALCAIFAFIFVPETRGLTLEQVDKMMEEVNPIQSNKWRMHDTFMHEMGSGRERRPFSTQSPPYPMDTKARSPRQEHHGFDFSQQ